MPILKIKKKLIWDLVKKGSKLLSLRDKEIINKCIPYTEVFKSNHMNEIIRNKDKYVIKSSLGRYSQEVYIGKPSGIYTRVGEFVTDKGAIYMPTYIK